MKTPFYDLARFPALHELFSQWQIVRDEFLQLKAPTMRLSRVGKDHEEVMQELQDYIAAGHPFGWIQGWGAQGDNPDWLQYGLVAFDEVIPYVSPVLHRTLGLLQRIYGIKICAFAQLNSGAMLPVHTHPEIDEEDLLQMHLPLVTATQRNYAYLNVGGEFRQFVAGQPLIFDGSMDHFALNESPTNRVILYMEFSRKLLVAD